MKSFGTGMAALRKSISPMAKALVGAGGAVIAFTSFKDIVYDLSKGTKDFKDVLPQLIRHSCFKVGTAMYIVLGPIGLVIGALAALGGAIVGHAKAVKEEALAELYDDIGISAKEMNTILSEVGGDITEYADKMNTYASSCNSLQTEYSELRTGIATDTVLIGGSAEEIKKQIEIILEKVKKLSDTTKEKTRVKYRNGIEILYTNGFRQRWIY